MTVDPGGAVNERSNMIEHDGAKPKRLASFTLKEGEPMPRPVCGVCDKPYEQRQNILKPVDRVGDMPWFPSCRHSVHQAKFV